MARRLAPPHPTEFPIRPKDFNFPALQCSYILMPKSSFFLPFIHFHCGMPQYSSFCFKSFKNAGRRLVYTPLRSVCGVPFPSPVRSPRARPLVSPGAFASKLFARCSSTSLTLYEVLCGCFELALSVVVHHRPNPAPRCRGLLTSQLSCRSPFPVL